MILARIYLVHLHHVDLLLRRLSLSCARREDSSHFAPHSPAHTYELLSTSPTHTTKKKNEKISKKGVARGRKPSRHALVVRQLANSLAKRVYFYVFGIGIK